MVNLVQQLARQTWIQSYLLSLQKLDSNIIALKKEYTLLSDSLSPSVNLNNRTANDDMVTTQRNALLDQIKVYQNTAGEVSMAIQSNAPSLIVLEKASVSAKADKPKKPEILLAAFISSILFGILAILIYHRKQAVHV